jgi:hypothetical protein
MEEQSFLRQENLPVPEHCTEHNPPCLMQHAALTTLETFWLQFFQGLFICLSAWE